MLDSVNTIKDIISSVNDIAVMKIENEKLALKMGEIAESQEIMFNVSDTLQAMNDSLSGMQVANISQADINAYYEQLGTALNTSSGIIQQFAVSVPTETLIQAQQAIQEIAMMNETFKSMANEPAMATAVQIGESLRGGGTVTFRHENININLAVNVEMSAEQIARGIIKTTVKGTSGKAGEEVKVVTDPNKYDFDI
jgi:hypothetical protein